MDSIQQSKLLLLPAELRTHIWQLSVSNTIINLDENEAQPGLLGTCRQIRNEVHGFFYSNLRFYTKFAHKVHALIDTLSPEHYNTLQEIRYDTSDEHTERTIPISSTRRGEAEWYLYGELLVEVQDKGYIHAETVLRGILINRETGEKWWFREGDYWGD